MGSNTRGVSDGFHEETRKVSALTSPVASVRDEWERPKHVNVSGVEAVSEIYAELSRVVAAYGAVIKHDAQEFDRFGVLMRVQDAQDARGGGGSR